MPQMIVLEDAHLASIDGYFAGYPELAGGLLIGSCQIASTRYPCSQAAVSKQQMPSIPETFTHDLSRSHLST